VAEFNEVVEQKPVLLTLYPT